jgi:hypothetical protein
MNIKKPTIGVIGGSRASQDILEIAYEIGKLLAQNDITLVCGGLGGVMEAVCKGAKEYNGFTIGILPGSDPEDANPYIDLPVVTGLGEARNMLVVLNSDLLIAIDGKYGTLSEMAFALLYGKPVIAIRAWELYREGEKDENIIYVDTPQQAVEKAMEILNKKIT